jgi:ubiquitin C-terminal hydrolase
MLGRNSATDKPTSRHPAEETPGLKNLGNTCFLNAVLQALTSVHAVHTYLLAQKTEGMSLTSTLKQTIKELCIARPAFEPYVAEHPELKRKFLTREQQDAHELMQYVVSMLDDEAESQRVRIPDLRLLSSLLQTNSSPFYLPLLDTEKISSTSYNYGKRNPFLGLMQSTLSVNCRKCGFVSSIVFQKFLNVSLSIPNKNTFTLDESLREFTNEELVSGVECPDCYMKRKAEEDEATEEEDDEEEPTVKLPPLKYQAKKQLTFARTPKVLCLHLRRLVRSGVQFRKLNCHVEFPEELDLTPYCSFAGGPEPLPGKYLKRAEPTVMHPFVDRFATPRRPNKTVSGLGGGSNYSQGEKDLYAMKNHGKEEKEPLSTTPGRTNSHLYRLVSVIVHLGDHLGGHYAVYRKLLSNPWKSYSDYDQFVNKTVEDASVLDKEPREWVYISDEQVRPAHISEVKKAQAYMLYYEKY